MCLKIQSILSTIVYVASVKALLMLTTSKHAQGLDLNPNDKSSPPNRLLTSLYYNKLKTLSMQMQYMTSLMFCKE